MLKPTTAPNIPRSNAWPAMEERLCFDGAPHVTRGYVTRMHGFTLESKIPHPAPVLLDYSSPCVEFPKVIDGPPVPRAFQIASGRGRTQELTCTWTQLCHLPETILSSARSEVAIRRLRLPANCATPITEYVDGDHVWYVYRGRGVVMTDIGQLSFDVGSYVYIPKGFASTVIAFSDTLMVGMYAECGFERPNMSPLLSHNSLREPYNEFDLRIPIPTTGPSEKVARDHGFQDEQGNWRVDHVRGGMRYVAHYDHSPLFCYGYQGTPYPFVLPVNKLITVTTPSVHTDPYWFTAFLSPCHKVAVSTFTDRRVHSLPYHHKNTYDEFLFLAEDYGPREGSGVGPGDAVFHPQGFMHGPQPEAFKRGADTCAPFNQPFVRECAIMFESALPLHRVRWSANEPDLEIPGYWRSWQRK